MEKSELKILFVCSQNRWRSLTAEKMYAGFPGYAVRSAGTEQNARIRVSAGHIGWADMIFVMEKRHVARLQDGYPDLLEHKKLICLHISDDYGFMEAELISVLKAKLAEHIAVPE